MGHNDEVADVCHINQSTGIPIMDGDAARIYMGFHFRGRLAGTQSGLGLSEHPEFSGKRAEITTSPDT
jgi:hydrogenase maturation factor HypE